jgi:hypothetical protein
VFAPPSHARLGGGSWSELRACVDDIVLPLHGCGAKGALVVLEMDDFKAEWLELGRGGYIG